MRMISKTALAAALLVGAGGIVATVPASASQDKDAKAAQTPQLKLSDAFRKVAAPAQAETQGACAAQLPKDARTIFDTTQPKVTPTSDLRAVVTANTRSLAMAGKIKSGSARDSALAAAHCLQLAGNAG